MSPRRVPIDEPGGAHRLETITTRRIVELENTVADLASLLARLDNVVAVASTVKSDSDSSLTEFESRVALLEQAFGITPDQPAADPNAPVDPNQPV